jgi:hypothetical protein
MRKILALPLVLALVLGFALPAAAARTKVIVLPGAHSAEGLTPGGGTTFYAADWLGGDIYRGDLRSGTAAVFIDVPDGVQTVGLDFDEHTGLLYAAGGGGRAYVYNVRTRSLVKTYVLGDPATSFVNGVTLTPSGAWFTDSLQPRLYFVPVRFGVPGPARTLNLSGPAAGPPGEFTLNDITSTPSGDTLLVSATLLDKVFVINPRTGASHELAGVTTPHVDGLVLETTIHCHHVAALNRCLQGHRLWAVEFGNRISRWRLNSDFTHGDPDGAITDPAFGAPLTAKKFGNRLAVVNSHLDTGLPPTSPTYEVVVVNS